MINNNSTKNLSESSILTIIIIFLPAYKIFYKLPATHRATIIASIIRFCQLKGIFVSPDNVRKPQTIFFKWVLKYVPIYRGPYMVRIMTYHLLYCKGRWRGIYPIWLWYIIVGSISVIIYIVWEQSLKEMGRGVGLEL